MRRVRALGGSTLAALVALAGVLASAPTARADTKADLVVTFSADGAAPSVLADVGIDDSAEVTPLVAEVSVDAEELAELRDHPDVVAVEEPVTYRAAALPNDPCIIGCDGVRTDYLEALGVPEAWEASTGRNVEIAVIDGGVDGADPDLAGRVIQEIDYLDGQPGLLEHGTAVAALAVAPANDGVGIAGIAPDARIRSFKVIRSDERGSSVAVAAAIRDASNLGVDVINLSLSGPNSTAIRTEIARAVSLGAVVVAAAGNIDGGGAQDPAGGYPARYPEVIAVGASSPADQAASFSYRGSWIDVFAPGTSLAAPVAGGPGHASFSGTSGAAPIVSGAVALLRSVQPSLAAGQVEARLRATSIGLGDGTTGERRLQVGSFVRGASLTLPSNGNPMGSVDAVAAGPSTVTVSGWALDPSTAAPIQVHVYVDGRGYASTASAHRSDIGALLPGYGPRHGFGVTVPAAGGVRTVCVYGIDVAAGGNQSLGCRTVTVGGSPFGALDLARQVPGGVQVSGWAIDPDLAGSIDVHAYAGASGVAIRADRARADIGRAFRAWGSGHGYLATIPTSASGPTSVCAYGIDVGAGSNAIVGCRVLDLRQSPLGAVDSVVRQGGLVRLRGWALDPGTAASIDVHVYVDGRLAAVSRATGQRADVAQVFAGYGADHGYDTYASAPRGAQVCIYGINMGVGGNALLACRAAP